MVVSRLAYSVHHLSHCVDRDLLVNSQLELDRKICLIAVIVIDTVVAAAIYNAIVIATTAIN